MKYLDHRAVLIKDDSLVTRLQALCEQAVSQTGIEEACIYLAGSAQALEKLAHAGAANQFPERLNCDPSLWERAGSPALHLVIQFPEPAGSQDPASLVLAQADRTGSVECFTLAASGGPTGVLAIYDPNRSKQTDDDLVTLRSFVERAQTLFENLSLQAALQASNQLIQTLHKLSSLSTRQIHLDETLDNILALVSDVVACDTSSIMLLNEFDGKLELVAGRGFDDLAQARQLCTRHGDQILATKWGQTEVVVMPDTRQDPRWFGIPDLTEIRSWVGAPLIANGRMIGFLNVDSWTAGAFDAQTGDVVQSFASQAALAIEGTRLLEAERKSRLRADALRHAAAAIGSSLSLEEVLKAVLDQIDQVIAYDSANIMLVEDHQVRLTAWRGYEKYSDPAVIPSVVFDAQTNPTFSPIFDAGEVQVIPDTHNCPGWQWTPISLHVRSWLGIPLRSHEIVIGAVGLDRTIPGGFSQDEVNLAQTFAQHAATAIENARLFEEMEKNAAEKTRQYNEVTTQRRHLSLLFDINREITSSLDPDEILVRALNLITPALDGLMGQGYLYLPEQNCLSMRALVRQEPPQATRPSPEFNLPIGQGVAGWVARERQTAIVPDVIEDERWYWVSQLDQGVCSMICSPILADKHILGVISILHPQRDAFNLDHQNLLEAICQEVGLALSNAQRYQQSQRRLAEITLIQQLGQTFNRRLDLQALLREVVDQLALSLGYPEVEIFLVENETLQLNAFHHTPPQITSYPLTQGVLGQAARSGKAILFNAPFALSETSTSDAPPKSQLVVPIFHNKSVVGVINIETPDSQQLDSQDLQLVELLAAQVSIALENAVLYERLVEHANDLQVTATQRTAELVELYQLSQEIVYQHSYDGMLRLLLKHLQAAMRCDLAIGCLATPDGSIILVEPGRPLMAETISMLYSQLQPHLNRFSGASGRDLLMETLNKHLKTIPHQEFASREGYETLIAPVQIEGQDVGTLLVASERMGIFGQAQERLLNTFANQAAAGIQRLQAALQAKQKELAELVEQLPVGTLLFNPEFELLVANSLGRQILAAVQGEIGSLERLGKYSRQELVEHAGDPLPLEIVLDQQPPRIFSARIRTSGQPGDENQKWLLTIHEVTRERENQSRIQTQERLATVGQLAAGIAHDFNNIMAAILVYTDLLNNDAGLIETSRNRIHTIQQQVERATHLIRQILDFSRSSVIEPSPMDLLPFLKELDAFLVRILPETIHTRVTYDPGRYWVRADPTHLQQVFMNLAVNARDAMPEGGKLQFDLRQVTPAEGPPQHYALPQQDWIQISVSDTGLGIQPADQEHLFEPFFTTKPVGHGTGLGLAQVYGIIRQHDGYIDVQSSPGKGTTFFIFLPALPGEPEHTATDDTYSLLVEGSERILVVEDDLATREALQSLLEAYKFRVLSATDGVDALNAIDHHLGQIDLVISDIVMPHMGGMALHQVLQQQWPEIKMIFMTGHPLDAEVGQTLQSGQIRWLQKPFLPKELHQVIRDILDSPPANSTSRSTSIR